MFESICQILMCSLCGCIIKLMSKMDNALTRFLVSLTRRRGMSLSRLAADLGVSHTTVSRWLSGKSRPGIRSCERLARLSDSTISKILALSGHMPITLANQSSNWPEFREYVSQKYPDEFDEDLILLIEHLIERRGSSKDDYKGDNKTT